MPNVSLPGDPTQPEPQSQGPPPPPPAQPNQGGNIQQGQQAPTSSAGNLLTTTFTLDNGWWVFIGCTIGVLASGTRIAPITSGILAVALIYQVNLLLQGK